MSDEINQCDGCQRGLPVNERGNHRGSEPWDIIRCTADRYSIEKVVDMMRTIDAYAFDYAKDGKLGQSRIHVERELRAALASLPTTSKE